MAVLGSRPSLPARVRQLVFDRVASLSATAGRLAAVAAVVGQAFDYALLLRASALPDAEAAEGVEELIRHRILRQLGEHFDFAHDRVREAVMDTLVGPQRRRLHRAVATAIEETRANDLDHHHATLAAHYRQAEDWLRAVDSLRQASMVTAARGAFREAADLLEQALEVLASLPRIRKRSAVPSTCVSSCGTACSSCRTFNAEKRAFSRPWRWPPS